jgi:hypothetical protein
MSSRRPLLYLETSVLGFCYDEEPRNALRRESVVKLLDQIRMGLLSAVTSPVTLGEIGRSREPLRSRLLALLEDVPTMQADRLEAERMARAYVDAGAVPEEYTEDALHVAYATVGRTDVLVTLNLRHLANEWAERSLAAVNLREGYQAVRIKTPEEVLRYED